MAHSYSRNKDYSSIQEFRDFVDDIGEVIDEYLEDKENDINNICEDDCISISEDLEISVVRKEGFSDNEDLYPISKLVRIEDDLLQSDYEEIEDRIVSNYLFVR